MASGEPSGYYLYCRFWPGFTDLFPYYRYTRVGDHAILRVVREELAQLRRQQRTTRHRSFSTSVLDESVVSPKHYSRVQLRSIRRSLRFLDSAREVGWYEQDRLPEVDLIAHWGAPFSPRVYIGSVSSSDLIVQLSNKADELFVRLNGTEVAARHNPLFQYVPIDLADPVDAEYELSQWSEGRPSIPGAETLRSLLPELRKYTDLWVATNCAGWVTGSLLSSCGESSQTDPIPVEYRSRPLTKVEAARFHYGTVPGHPQDYINNRIAWGIIRAPMPAAGRKGIYDIRDFPEKVREDMRPKA